MSFAVPTNRRVAFLAAALAGLCDCSLAFSLDGLQGAADTVAGDAAAPTDDGSTRGNGGGGAFEGQGASEASDTPPPDSPPLTTIAAVIADAAAPTADAAAPEEAAALVVDAAGASAMEAAVATDARGDATESQDSAGSVFDAGSWCAANTTGNTVYCNDFDEPTSTVKGTWDSVFFNGSDCASLDSPSDAPSGPHTLLLSTPIVASGSTFQEQFVKYPANVNSETLRFALKISGFDPNAKDLSLVWMGYKSAVWSVTFDVGGTGAHLFESVKQANGTFQGVTHPVAQPPLGVWTMIALTVDAAGNKMSLSYDGNPVAIATSTIMNPPSPLAAFSTILGANYLQGPAQPMKISYDDVLISVN